MFYYSERVQYLSISSSYFPVVSGTSFHTMSIYGTHMRANRKNVPAREYGVTERMDFRLCPGLAKIKAEECDAIAIAGMGGETILGILEAAPWTHEDVHTLILQPQTKIDLLRCWLCGHGYRFLSETLVRDKEQLYVVFRVRAGMGQELSEADALTGLLLRSDPLYGEYLSQHLIKLNRARDGLAVSSLADKEARIAHLENLIEEIERRKGEWEHGNGT